MLIIRDTESEINIVGEICNSVLELLGGDSNHDGFGFEKSIGKTETKVSLENITGGDITISLSLIRDAIRKSHEDAGIFSYNRKHECIRNKSIHIQIYRKKQGKPCKWNGAK